jgi:ligand-binding SRPBCC domain-containing protein
MTIHSIARDLRLPISPGEAWSFFSDPRNLEEITPPDMGFRTLGPLPEAMFEGQIIAYKLRIFPAVHLTWVTEIKSVEEGKSFVDEQRFGPYKFWHHRHSFEEIPGGVLMRDRVHYALGCGPFGTLAHAMFVKSKLREIFDFRQRILRQRFGKL